MWDVKIWYGTGANGKSTSFTLTMWDVKIWYGTGANGKSTSFTLTMWDVKFVGKNFLLYRLIVLP